MTHSRSTKIIIRMSAALKTCSRAGGSRPGLAKTASSRRDTRAWWRTTNPRINSWLETEGKCRSLAKITALTRKATRELQNLWLRHVERCKQIHSHLMKHDSDQSWIFRKKIRPNLQGPYFGQRVQEKKTIKQIRLNLITCVRLWISILAQHGIVELQQFLIQLRLLKPAMYKKYSALAFPEEAVETLQSTWRKMKCCLVQLPYF